MKFTKQDARIDTATEVVSLNRADGRGSFTITVAFRLDGRDGDFFRVDMGALTGWEAIDGGETSAPKTRQAAVALAHNYLTRVREQGTMHPL